jgi:CBS domain containing-hemolysin-like protein
MSTGATVALALAAVAVLYFLSSGIAFALMYRLGERFPSQIAGTLYEPLEWLSRRFSPFRFLYNGLHSYCYRIFVGKLVNGWVPPPPNIAKDLEKRHTDDERK